jgi:hypothetical protein
MSQVVVEKAHLRHERTNWKALGFLDTLLHVVALQLHGVTRENCELVEFNAVQKRSPGLHTRSLVGFPVYSDPGVFAMHFLDNLVPLSPSFADKVIAN